jgi:general secretion pathway protein G
VFIESDDNLWHTCNGGMFMAKRGFTLIELIVVIAIIAILAAIIAPNAFRAIEKSKVARVVQDSKVIKTAAYAMYGDTGLWPGSNWADDAATDRLAPAAQGEGFVFKGNNANMPNTWDGPYIDKLPFNPWGGQYWWDYNDPDQNGDGIGQEHVLWIDNGQGNTGKRIPDSSRLKIDQTLDDGNLSSGRIQVWQGTNLGYILIQGQG